VDGRHLVGKLNIWETIGAKDLLKKQFSNQLSFKEKEGEKENFEKKGDQIRSELEAEAREKKRVW